MMSYYNDLRDLTDERIDLTTDLDVARDTLLQNRSKVWILTNQQVFQPAVIDDLDQYLANEYSYCAKFDLTDPLIGYVYSNEPEATCSLGNAEPLLLSPCKPSLITGIVESDLRE